MKRKTFTKYAVVVLISLMLSACGFHVRTAYELPSEYTPVSIEMPRRYRDFNKTLKTEMGRAGIALATESDSPGLFVKLSSVSENEDLLTASATGSPLERELILKATVNWEDPQGVDVIKAETFRLNRTFVYDDTAVLSKRREAAALMRELERELSRRIILRMGQIGK